MDFSDIFNILGKDKSRIAPNSTGGATFPNVGPIDITPGPLKGFGGFAGGTDTNAAGKPVPEITIGGPEGDAAAPGTGSAEVAGSGGIGASIENYFTRAIVIVLGFIFVAVGLSMFRGETVIRMPGK